MADLVQRLVDGEIDLVVIEPEGTAHTDRPQGVVVLAGSFNPLHEGHERMLAAAARITGRKPYYELSVTNVEKPPVPREVLEARARQFKGKACLLLTRAPTFVEKARIIPGTVFVIGYDTAVRLFPDRYYPKYDPSKDRMGAGSAVALALDSIRESGCSFLVAGRAGSNGKFRTLDDIEVPERFRPMLEQIPESEFRADVSSTELRARGRAIS